MENYIEIGQHVILLWGTTANSEDLKESVNNLRAKVGSNGNIAVENISMLMKSSHTSGKFDLALVGFLYRENHSAEILGEIARILKPGGKLIIREPVSKSGKDVTNYKREEKLKSSLVLSGFINIGDPKECLQNGLEENLKLVEFHCFTPEFQFGSVAQLKLPQPLVAMKRNEQAAKVWTLSAMDALDDDVELLDSDQLLDEDDLKIPDPSSLKVCGTTGKRKACKNCSCGLAEELAEIRAPTEVKSSCGSCYLGDAFRCASCPYLGMPPFNPGEKVVLNQQQLKADA